MKVEISKDDIQYLIEVLEEDLDNRFPTNRTRSARLVQALRAVSEKVG